MGFKLNNIEPVTSKAVYSSKMSFLQKEITLFGNDFSSKIKENFYTELSVLLKAGITLKESLELIKDTLPKERQTKKLDNIITAIISGNSLSQAINNLKEFTNYEYYSLKIGEETGTLLQVTEQLGAFYRRKNEQRRNLISALTYPIIILFTAFLVIVFMLQFVVPMFHDIFEQQNLELPLITKIIIRCSEFLKKYGWILFIIFLVVIFSRTFLNKKMWYKKNKDKLILKLPFIGEFIKTLYLSQFTQAVSLLTVSKVPVVQSINLVKQMIDFYPLQNSLEIIENNILKGKSLSESLKEHSFFDAKMIALVKVAEETNKNEFVFERLNIQYNLQVEQKSKLLATLMEPLIIILVGFIVGVILVAMYLPMFKLSSIVG